MGIVLIMVCRHPGGHITSKEGLRCGVVARNPKDMPLAAELPSGLHLRTVNPKP